MINYMKGNDQLDFKKFCKVKLYYESALKELETKLNIINSEFSALSSVNPINHIKTRMKSLPSIIDKLKRKNLKLNIENTFILGDIVGARIVCNFIDDVYRVIDKLKTNKDINIIEEKDYIKTPKSSGYRGYHIIISIPITINGIRKNIKTEIQIRTCAMDFWASSEHRLNYKKVGLSNSDKEELKKLSNDIWEVDQKMNLMAKKKLDNEKISYSDTINISAIKEIVNWRKQNEIFE